MSNFYANRKWGGVIYIILAVFCVHIACAQDRWKGTQLEKIDASLVDNSTGKITEYGDTFYLYNVGTGKFVTCDAYGGMQAVLKYKDFGSAMNFGYSTAKDDYNAAGEKVPNIIHTGIQGVAYGHESKHHPYCLSISYPKVTYDKDKGTWSEHQNAIFGVIMDGHPEADCSVGGNGWYRTHLKFIRVETDPKADTYTYRILEELDPVGAKNKKYCFLGAIWGHSRYADSKIDIKQDTTNLVLFSECDDYDGTGAQMAVTETKYYQWRFVTKHQMDSIAALENADNYGIPANLSYVLSDPLSDRNRNAEFQNGWKVQNLSTTNIPMKKEPGVNTNDSDCPDRYTYTFRYPWTGSESNISDSTVIIASFKGKNSKGQYGDENRAKNYVRTIFSQPWDEAILRKVQSVTKANGKYTYSLLEGIGYAYQKANVPMPGYYRIECTGLATGHNATLFAEGSDGKRTANFKSADAELGAISKIEVWKDRSARYIYYNAGGVWDQFDEWDKLDEDNGFGDHYARRHELYSINGDGLITVGQRLYDYAADYKVSVIVYVDDSKTVTIGVEKEKATQSNAIKREWLHNYGTAWASWDLGSTEKISRIRVDNYYYDTDITAFDNFQVYYLGKNAPFVLDEDSTSQTYIEREFSELDPSDNTKKRNGNIATYLHRTFTKGQWNSLVLPVDLSVAQVMEYFGDDAKLARLHGVNSYQSYGEDGVVDFKTVDFKLYNDDGTEIGYNTTGKAIEAGKMYIIKPTKEPTDIFYLEKDVLNADGSKTKQVTKVDNCYMIGNHDYTVDGGMPKPAATYGIDPESTDRDPKVYVEYEGTYNKLTRDSLRAPHALAYVFSNGDMYRLSGKNGIKGFRGWLYGRDSKTHDAKSLTFGIDLEDTATFIDGVSTKPEAQTKGVYSLGGQLVRKDSSSVAGLPKGIYIVNGRKVIVK